MYCIYYIHKPLIVSSVKEQRRLRLLRGLFGCKKKQKTEENYILRSFIVCTLHCTVVFRVIEP
jgi:hypothetical protein